MSAFRMLLCTAHIRFYPKRTSRGPLLRPNLYVTGFNTKYDSDESNLMSQCGVVTDFRECHCGKGTSWTRQTPPRSERQNRKKAWQYPDRIIAKRVWRQVCQGPPQRHDAQDLTQRNRLHLVARVSEASP